MKKISELQCGKIGEHLVCADLLLRGHDAFLSEQGLRYDVVCDIGGRLIKIQVKTTSGQSRTPARKGEIPGYCFHLRTCGAGGRKRYDPEAVDIFALVVIATREIGYIAARRSAQTMLFSPPIDRSLYYGASAKAKHLKAIEMRKAGATYDEIQRETGLHKSSACKVCKHGIVDKRKRVRYLIDMGFDEALASIGLHQAGRHRLDHLAVSTSHLHDGE